jgi:hypothetical protein
MPRPDSCGPHGARVQFNRFLKLDGGLFVGALLQMTSIRSGGQYLYRMGGNAAFETSIMWPRLHPVVVCAQRCALILADIALRTLCGTPAAFNADTASGTKT